MRAGTTSVLVMRQVARRAERSETSPAIAAWAFGEVFAPSAVALQRAPLLVLVNVSGWPAPLARVPLFGGQGTSDVDSWCPGSPSAFSAGCQ